MVNMELVNQFIENMNTVFDGYVKSKEYLNMVSLSETYYPSKKDIDIIIKHGIKPEIDYVKGKIDRLQNVIIPEINKVEKELLKGQNVEDITDRISETVEKKSTATEALKGWHIIYDRLLRTKTQLFAGDLHIDPTLLVSIRNAKAMKEVSLEFVRKALADEKIKAFLDATITDIQAVKEVSDVIIDTQSLFLTDVEEKVLRKDLLSFIKMVYATYEILCMEHPLFKDETTKDSEEAKELLSRLAKLKEEVETTKDLEDSTQESIAYIKRLIPILELIKHFTKDIKTDNVLVYEFVTEVENVLKSSDFEGSSNIVTLLGADHMEDAYSIIKTESDNRKASKLNNSKSNNLWLSIAIKLCSRITCEVPKSKDDMEYIKACLMVLYFYVKLIPNENFRTCSLYTI